MIAWESGSGYDTYPGAAVASYSSIVGSDDVVLNAQLSTSAGCRHCKVAAVAATSGHLGFALSTNAFIAGETEYSYILGATEATIIGSDDDSGDKTTTELVLGGFRNVIDMSGVDGNGLSGRNVIIAGSNNAIDTDGAGDQGCDTCAIIGSKSSNIQNRTTSGVRHIENAAIVGGQLSEVIALDGEIAPDGAVVTGSQGSAWMPHMRSHGSGPGYDSADLNPGALQTFDVMYRKRAPTNNADHSMNPSVASDNHKLQYAGMYTISVTASCQVDTTITTTAPSKVEVWETTASMWWLGSTNTPQVFSATDLTPGASLILDTLYTYGGANTWVMKIITAASGSFKFTINPGTDADALLCQADAHFIMSRQDS
jgi:hypothetical protein